jgi:murein L,D-transpeptidase YafK
MAKISTMIVLLTLSSLAFANEFFPSVIYQLDSKFSHHVIVVEKSTHTLYLYENDNQKPKLIKTYKVATGKNIGNKQAQGDEKTPEGIYQFQKFHPASELIEKYGKEGLIYGAGAFTMNYPNEVDRRLSKTGGGIWLHSTDNDERVSKGLDSRGCVVATDADLKDISQYIDLNHTSIIVTQNLNFYTKDSWLKNKEDITKTVVSWANAWKDKDFNKYIEQYSKTDFQSSRGGYEAYKNYKKAIFSRTEEPQIAFRHISMMQFNDYAVVTMEQDYRSSLIQDIGKKTLYLKQDASYNWKIISEQFNRLPDETNIAFIPKMRFFTEGNQVKTANDSGSI